MFKKSEGTQRYWRRRALAALAAGCLAGAGAAPAVAATAPADDIGVLKTTCAYGPSSGTYAGAGRACFDSDGDWFEVWDSKSDGFRTVATWRTSYGREGMCQNTIGTIPGAESMHPCNYDFREGETVYFRFQVRNGSTVKWSSALYSATI